MAAELGGWKFKTRHVGRWVWQQVSPAGDVLLDSDVDFPSIEQCAFDAQRRGYPGVIADYANPD
ncbi:MAG TPA: hypothetical protein VD867_13230 [Burkholderiales bacterium]|nr:hypothetical protein [Burkholderiales bacterium]